MLIFRYIQKENIGRECLAIARKKLDQKAGAIQVALGRPNSKPQWAFFRSKKKYTCYGGARGGGKSWAVRVKAVGGALTWDGIKILIIRRRYTDMQNSLIDPLVKLVPQELGFYNATQHMVYFLNGSTIKFGHLESYSSTISGEYQGQEYDWIFMDEATQFTEGEFRGLAACLRGVNDIPKRFYLTCNPGGIGHQWVKRLFVERRFKETENPNDYVFIPATVEDNRDLMEASPDYLAALELLPEDIRRAHRYGDWDALAGTFFSEFDRTIHTYDPRAVTIPNEWARYRAFDYGLDMFACLWAAVDFEGGIWIYREAAQSRLVVSQAAQLMHDCTPSSEWIRLTVAPPDMWSTQKDSGKTMAQIWQECGVGIVRGNNSRVQGWMAVKEALRVRGGKPGLHISRDCAGLLDCLPALQHDEKNPSDCATQPHEITHLPDALRYFCQYRVLKPEMLQPITEDEEEPTQTPYQQAMCGGAISRGYIGF